MRLVLGSMGVSEKESRIRIFYWTFTLLQVSIFNYNQEIGEGELSCMTFGALSISLFIISYPVYTAGLQAYCFLVFVVL